MVATVATSTREERVIAEVRRLSQAGLDGLDLLRRTTIALRPLVPFDASCATTTDPASNLITHAASERESGRDGGRDGVFDNYFARVYMEHDLGLTLAMLRERRSVALLSEATAGRPERSGRWRLHLAPRGLGPEVYATFVDKGLWGELHLTRDAGAPDFSPREVELLRRLAPHVGAGLKVAALHARAVVGGGAGVVSEHDAADVPGVLIVDGRNRVVSSTANAERFLAELGPLDPAWRSGRNLPVAVQVVLGALRTAAAPVADRDRHRVPRLRARTRDGRWLTIHASLTEASAERASERVVVVAPAQQEEIAWLTLAAYELSPREEEVVRLVVRGLSTRQIADELFIAEHTVQRHLSNIFEKVGVRGRRALVKQLFVEQVLPSLN